MDILIWSVLLSFVFCVCLGHFTIPLLKRLKFGQTVRDDGPQSHLGKTGTPTMGGIFMLIALFAASLIFMQEHKDYLFFALLITLGYALVGFLDDYIKVVKKRSLGLKAYQKIIGQFGLAVIIAIYAYTSPNIGSTLIVPFTDIQWDLGFWFIPFTIFVVIATVNSVNLTDGLDGLASSVTLVSAATFSVFAIFISEAAMTMGQTLYAGNVFNIALFGCATVGACMGFLAYNAHPAKVFMGDTGSLALGGAMAAMAIVLRMQLFIPIIGLMFLMSSVTSILQVASCKIRKKRMFRMAPLHHHFELCGVSEPKIVTMYTVVTVLCSLIALLSVL